MKAIYEPRGVFHGDVGARPSMIKALGKDAATSPLWDFVTRYYVTKTSLSRTIVLRRRRVGRQPRERSHSALVVS